MTACKHKGVYIFPTIYNLFSMTDFTTSIFHNNKEPASSVCECVQWVNRMCWRTWRWTGEDNTDALWGVQSYSFCIINRIMCTTIRARAVWIVNMLAGDQTANSWWLMWIKWDCVCSFSANIQNIFQTQRLYHLYSILWWVNTGTTEAASTVFKLEI